MTDLTRIAGFALLVSLSAYADEQLSEPVEPKPVSINRDWVETGSRSFRLLTHDAEDGRMDVSTRFTDNNEFVIHDHSVGVSMGVDEDIFTRLSATDFSPISADITGTFGETHVSMRYDVSAGSVEGAIRMHQESTGRFRERPVSLELPEGTLFRSGTLMLAGAMSGLVEGGTVELNWFNALSGQLATITLEVEGSQQVTVPAGEFDCLVVRLTGGQPGNIIYINKADRRVVRFDVIDQPIRLELLPQASSEG